MKYAKLTFSASFGFHTSTTDSLDSYKKGKLYGSFSKHHMYIDADKLEIGREKFKKKLLEHYNNIINEINKQI